MPQHKSAVAHLGSLLASSLALFSSVRAVGLVGRPRAVINEKAAIISATLAVKGAELPLCEGLNDLLPVTFSFPVSGDPAVPTLDPSAFEVTLLSNSGEDENEVTTVTPKCATLAPAAEPDERRTVLLLGAFAPEAGVGPVKVEVVGDISLALPGGQEVSATGTSFRQPPMGPDDFLGNSDGPNIVDYELLEPAANATADANGCSALFPDTTDVVRLIYASGVRERNLTDSTGEVPLDNLGVAADVNRANSMFTIASSVAGLFGRQTQFAVLDTKGVSLLGIADVDADNVVDLCVTVSGRVPNKLYVNMKCGAECFDTHSASSPTEMDDPDADADSDESAIVFGPSGIACSTQVVVVKSNYKVRRSKHKAHKSKKH